MCGPLHLYHLRLNGAVGPYTAVCAHVSANRIEGTCVAVSFKLEVEHGILWSSFSVSHTLVVDCHVVHLCISGEGGHRVDGVVARNAANVDWVGEVAQHTAFASSSATTVIPWGRCCSGCLSAFQLSVDEEFHLLAVP